MNSRLNILSHCHLCYLLVFLILILCPGCKRLYYYSQLSLMSRSDIRLPENLTFIQNGKESPLPDYIKGSALFLVFIDSTQCSDCRIRQLIRYDPIIRLSENRNTFEVLILLSIYKSDCDSVSKRLTDSNLPYAIAIDRDNMFLQMNPRVPSNPVFHTMLLNTRGQPVFVGDPTISKKNYELFYSKLDDI